jgi:hypothetical protein
MRSSADINQVTVLVDSQFATFRDFGLYELQLEWVVLEHLQSFFFAHDKSSELLLLINHLLSSLFNTLVVFLFELLIATVGVIEETILGGRTVTQVHSVLPFK